MALTKAQKKIAAAEDMPSGVTEMEVIVQRMKEFKVFNRDPDASQEIMPLKDRLPLNRFAVTVNVSNHWTATVPTGTPIAHLFIPQFWANRNVGNVMTIGDVIVARPDDLAWWCELLVVGTSPLSNEATVRMLRCVEFEDVHKPDDISPNDPYYTEHRGLTDKWIVVRRLDGHVMAKGLATRQAAMQHIKDMVPLNLSGGLVR